MSENIIDGVDSGKFNSLRSDQCHKTCFATYAVAIYSASSVEGATVDCFFELHATAPPEMGTMYPLIDFLSRSDAQSTSQ